MNHASPALGIPLMGPDPSVTLFVGGEWGAFGERSTTAVHSVAGRICALLSYSDQGIPGIESIIRSESFMSQKITAPAKPGNLAVNSAIIPSLSKCRDMHTFGFPKDFRQFGRRLELGRQIRSEIISICTARKSPDSAAG